MVNNCPLEACEITHSDQIGTGPILLRARWIRNALALMSEFHRPIGAGHLGGPWVISVVARRAYRVDSPWRQPRREFLSPKTRMEYAGKSQPTDPRR